MKRLLTISLLVILLQSCAAVTAPAMVLNLAVATADLLVTGIYNVFKTVITSSGERITVSFSENELSPENRLALKSFNKPVIWPGDELEVFMANKLELSGGFHKLHTPNASARLLGSRGLETQIALLTDSERMAVFDEICEVVRADSVIVLLDGGEEDKTSLFTIGGTRRSQISELLVYSHAERRIIYTATLMLVRDVQRAQNEKEIQQITGEALAEKILELRTQE